MYTQAMDIPSPERDEALKSRGPRSLAEQQRDAEYEAEFDAKVARGEFIEAKDWMPDHYRKTLDEPIPALGDLSPRAAAQTAAGRRKVADWLKRWLQ